MLCMHSRACFVSSEVAQCLFWTVHRELSSSWDKFCSALHCSAVYLSYGNKGFVKTVLTSVLVSIAV